MEEITLSEMRSLPDHVTVRPTSLTYGQVIGAMLWSYVGPVIFIVGVIGNILVLVVMSQRRMRGTSTCVYLQWMAVADVVFLLAGMIPEWLEARHIVVLKETHPVLCKLEKFTSYTSSDTSIWICVIFTLDRFVAVCFPLERRASACQPWRAKYFAAVALLAAVAKNLHVLWTRGPEFAPRQVGSANATVLVLKRMCGRPTPEYRNFEKFVRPWIAFSVVSALPFCIIVFCNIFIIRALIRMRRERRHVTAMTSSGCGGAAAAADDNVTQMTVLCLSVSFCFLICITPSMILVIGRPYWNRPSAHWYAIAKSVTNQIFYVNHSANFFLYCITGRRFRAALRAVFRSPEVEAYDVIARRRLVDNPRHVVAAAVSVAVAQPCTLPVDGSTTTDGLPLTCSTAVVGQPSSDKSAADFVPRPRSDCEQDNSVEDIIQRPRTCSV